MTLPPQNGGDTLIDADFFYSVTCSHCIRVKPLVEKLAEDYPQVHVRYREVYFNATNRELFRDLTDRYGVESETIPLLIIGTTAMAGEKEIRTGLEPYVAHVHGEVLYQSDIRQSPVRFTGSAPESGGTDSRNNTTSLDTAPPRKAEITLASVLVAAAIDSINPCAFAVLVVLLAYLTSLADRKRLLQVGFAYIGTVFIVYLLSGIGFFAIIRDLGNRIRSCRTHRGRRGHDTDQGGISKARWIQPLHPGVDENHHWPLYPAGLGSLDRHACRPR